MSSTSKKSKQPAKGAKKSEGFSAEEKAAMRARAKELKANEDGESAIRDAIAKMSPQDRAIALRESIDLIPTWHVVVANTNQDDLRELHALRAVHRHHLGRVGRSCRIPIDKCDGHTTVSERPR